MKYGYFDNTKREYVINDLSLPYSWTNYLGTEKTGAVLNQNGGGYMWHDSAEHHRITRFIPNANDRPGHYLYLKDENDNDYWSLTYDPVCKDLNKAKYETRFGLSYNTYSCLYKGIKSEYTLFIPRGEECEIWNVKIKNESNATRKLSLYTYCAFSFNQVEIDNQNFQMSLYSQGSSYEDGVIEIDGFYDPTSFHYLTASFYPDHFETMRDFFIGAHRTESNPIGLEQGLTDSTELGGNHVGVLQKIIELKQGEEIELNIFLGVGNREKAKAVRAKFTNKKVIEAFNDLKAYWNSKLEQLQVKTPDEDMNTMINLWNLYQAETNIVFSRFSSFIEVGGRTGLGYRDTAQDAMCVIPSNREKCKQRIIELLRGLTEAGYGLHLFEPELFDPDRKPSSGFVSPTVKPEPNKGDLIHGIKDACSDDALWLIPTIAEYVKETGDVSFFTMPITYAEGSKDNVYEHMKRIISFSFKERGDDGVVKGLRADWNDCLNLGGGESSLSTFLLYQALVYFEKIATLLEKEQDAESARTMIKELQAVSDKVLWDGEWFIRGITKNGKKIGDSTAKEGKVHLESNAWGPLSGICTKEQSIKALDSIEKYLKTDYGLRLNAPSFETPDDDIGFVTRVYKGIKENGAIFSHSNPWVWAAETTVGNGDRAYEYYSLLCPAKQNDIIEVRQSEPYSYCQFIMGPDHTAHGRARHPWLTGSAGWAYYATVHYMLGIQPDYDKLVINPVIPKKWDKVEVVRIWRGAKYNITILNPNQKGSNVTEIKLNGKVVKEIPPQEKDSVNEVIVTL